MSRSSRKFERKASLSICPEVSVGFFATYALPWSASRPQKLRSPTLGAIHPLAIGKANRPLRTLAFVGEYHINHLLPSLMVKNMGEERLLPRSDSRGTRDWQKRSPLVLGRQRFFGRWGHCCRGLPRNCNHISD